MNLPEGQASTLHRHRRVDPRRRRLHVRGDAQGAGRLLPGAPSSTRRPRPSSARTPSRANGGVRRRRAQRVHGHQHGRHRALQVHRMGPRSSGSPSRSSPTTGTARRRSTPAGRSSPTTASIVLGHGGGRLRHHRADAAVRHRSSKGNDEHLLRGGRVPARAAAPGLQPQHRREQAAAGRTRSRPTSSTTRGSARRSTTRSTTTPMCSRARRLRRNPGPTCRRACSGLIRGRAEVQAGPGAGRERCSARAASGTRDSRSRSWSRRTTRRSRRSA